MDGLLSKLEEIKDALVAEGIQSLQNDVDLGVHVVAALPKVRGLIQTLKQIQAQAQAQSQTPAQQ